LNKPTVHRWKDSRRKSKSNVKIHIKHISI
jgi:hypothetical protein